MPITGPIPLPMTGMEAYQDARQRRLQSELIGAQAQREKARAQLPFGGMIPPGAAGQTVGLEMIRIGYGEDSPQYKQAKELYELNKNSTQSRIDYQNILSGTAPKRFSTNLGKTFHEMEDLNKGFLPGTQIPIPEDQRKNIGDRYGLQLLKNTTDSDTRRRAQFAENIDLTLDQLDPKALTHYSGIKGTGKLLMDASRSAAGESIPEYEAYTNAQASANLLAKQVRQFYGDSITPSIQEGLKKLTNPTSWIKDPKVALSNFNKFVSILKSEQKTFRGALQSPKVYQEDEMMPSVGDMPLERSLSKPEKSNVKKWKVVDGKLSEAD